MGAAIHGAAFAILVWAIAAPAAAAETASQTAQSVRLTSQQMLALGERAYAAGDLESADRINRALEQDRDTDVRAEARFRRARQLAHQNRNHDAALLLRRIVDEKPNATVARLELARILHLLGQPDAALRELRAAQSAGLPSAVARLVDRYSEALRAARPLGASLEIALAQDSNVNRATRSGTLGTIFGDFDIEEGGKARSGTGVSLRGHAYRRFPIGQSDASILVRGGVSADLYGKSRFNDIALDFATGPELQIGANRINFELGATQRWFGQEPYARSARLGAMVTRPIGAQMQLRLSGSAALVDHRVNDLQDGKTYSGRIDIERALSPTTGVALNLGLERQDLRDAAYSTTGWRAGLLGWKNLGRTTLTAGAEIARLNADERLALFPQKRSDRYSRLSLGAAFRQLSFEGFAPVARFTIERNRSTIELYDYSRRQTELGIVRAF